MSFASRNNKASFEIPFDTSNFDFVKCADLQDDVTYQVYGYFSVTGQYGKQYNLITDKFYVTLPKHMTDAIDAFTDDDVADIKAGKVGIKKRIYKSKQGKDCATIVWVDM